MAVNKTVDNERWLTDGDCSKCRREKFCSKRCKRAELKERAEIANLIADSVKEALQENDLDDSDQSVKAVADKIACDENVKKMLLTEALTEK